MPDSHAIAAPHPADAFAGRTFDGVLLDLDGTLIDSGPAGDRCWQRWATEEGLDLAVLAGGPGLPAAEIVARLLPPERVAAAFARIMAYELTDTAGIVAQPGAVAALAAVPAGRAAIVTSCTRELLAVRARAAGLPLPAHVVTFDDVRRGKPAPDPFLAGAAALGADPARCLVVEDTPAGLAAGRAAGCATLAVAGTHALAALEADAAAADLSHVRFVAAAGGVAVARAA